MRRDTARIRDALRSVNLANSLCVCVGAPEGDLRLARPIKAALASMADTDYGIFPAAEIT